MCLFHLEIVVTKNVLFPVAQVKRCGGLDARSGFGSFLQVLYKRLI